jgi:hypothetical protein
VLNYLAVNAISIPNNISRSRVIGKSVKKLLRGPFCGWMRGDIEVNDAAPLMGKNEEDVENAEGDYRDCEEIDGDKLFGVVFQKCAPCLRGRFWMPKHMLGDSRLGNVDSEFEQFAMNSRGAPEAIVLTQWCV